MKFDAELLNILACPQDRQPIMFIESESIFYNPRLRFSYPIRDGIPVLLIDEATKVSDDEHERLMQLPEVTGAESET